MTARRERREALARYERNPQTLGALCSDYRAAHLDPVNRIALGLGVEHGEEEVQGYKA